MRTSPIWVGGLLRRGRRPEPGAQACLPGISGITLQTQGDNGLVISDGPDGGILIQTAGGAKIEVTDTGHHALDRPGRDAHAQDNTVDVNSGALTVK